MLLSRYISHVICTQKFNCIVFMLKDSCFKILHNDFDEASTNDEALISGTPFTKSY